MGLTRLKNMNANNFLSEKYKQFHGQKIVIPTD